MSETGKEKVYSEAEIAELLLLRDRVKELIEERRPKKKGERLEGQLGSSQDAVVHVTAQPHRVAALRALSPVLADLCIVSKVVVTEGSTNDPTGVDLSVEHSTVARCERCWNHREDVGVRSTYPDLCVRCADVVAGAAVGA